jgi:hypothetical protein
MPIVLAAGILGRGSGCCQSTIGAPTLSAEQIASAAYNRNIGRDSTAGMTMIITSASGNERRRQLDAFSLDTRDETMTLIRFISPKDIAGTAFLAISRDDGTEEQHLYLPALRRARRIAGNMKRHLFVNSDFTYEDLERRHPDRDSHRLLGVATHRERACWQLEDVPKPESNSQYGRIMRWITQDGDLPVRIDLYDKRDTLVKRYEALEWKPIQGIWTITMARMTDLAKKRSTTLLTERVVYDTDLSEGLFAVRNLAQH